MGITDLLLHIDDVGYPNVYYSDLTNSMMYATVDFSRKHTFTYPAGNTLQLFYLPKAFLLSIPKQKNLPYFRTYNSTEPRSAGKGSW